jgi:UDP-glucose 4-epimerase
MHREHRILITGGSGALGYHILTQLKTREDVQLLALSRESSKLHPVHSDVPCKRIAFEDMSALRSVMAQFSPTCVIHSAAAGLQRPRPKWFDLAAFNIDFTVRLFECVAAAARCQFIFISTGLAYRSINRPLREEDPIDTLHPYGATKGAADVLLRSAAADLQIPLTVIRPFSFTGIGDPAGRLFPSLLSAASDKLPFDMSAGLQRRDHCATSDIASGITTAALNLAGSPTSPFVVNLGSGSDVSLKQLVSDVVEQLELEVKINFGARDYAMHEPMHLVADTARARELLGWQPKMSLAYSVWELAKTAYPQLHLKEPKRSLF